MKKLPSLVFFGSGIVGEATLIGLLRNGFTIEAIITKKKPQKHRDNMPVEEFARSHSIPYFTPVNKIELSELFKQQQFHSKIGLVVDYGIIIEQSVIELFPFGIINSHFSLLPQWRGADPITFSILSGQSKTGVSLMLINQYMDRGLLIGQEEIAISPADTTPTLTQRLIILSNDMLQRLLPEYLAGTIKPFAQSSKNVSYSRKLTKNDSIISWDKPALLLEREIRAFLGWPKSVATICGQRVIILKARLSQGNDKEGLIIPCQDSFIEIIELIGPSGKRMSGDDFKRGYCQTSSLRHK